MNIYRLSGCLDGVTRFLFYHYSKSRPTHESSFSFYFTKWKKEQSAVEAKKPSICNLNLFILSGAGANHSAGEAGFSPDEPAVRHGNDFLTSGRSFTLFFHIVAGSSDLMLLYEQQV